jgi:hypothetical protein
MDSILTSIKKLLGIEEEYTHFDADIIIYINSILSVLTQLGIGPTTGYAITDKTAKWEDFLGEGAAVGTVQAYVYLRVRLLFDPPTAAAAIESMNRIVSEFEWRLHVSADPVLVIEEPVSEEDTPS